MGPSISCCTNRRALSLAAHGGEKTRERAELGTDLHFGGATLDIEGVLTAGGSRLLELVEQILASHSCATVPAINKNSQQATMIDPWAIDPSTHQSTNSSNPKTSKRSRVSKKRKKSLRSANTSR